jgi:hypothetical protein
MNHPFIPTPKPFYEKKKNLFIFDFLVEELRSAISNFPDKLDLHKSSSSELKMRVREIGMATGAGTYLIKT